MELGEIGVFTRGRRFTKKDVVAEGIPSIHYGEIYTRYKTWTLAAVSHVRADLRDRLRFAKHGDVVVAGVGETVEDVAKAVAWLGDEEVAFHDDCFAFRHDQDAKYIAYAMQTANFQKQKNRYVVRAKVKRLSGESLARTKIPVPPLEIQREIVRVLDRFAELEAELEAELSLRDEQHKAISLRLLMEASAGMHGKPVERVRIGTLAKQSFRPEVLAPGARYNCLGVKWYGAGAYLRESRLGNDIKATSLNRVRAGQFLYNRMFVTEGSFAIVDRGLDGGLVSNEFPVYDLDKTRIEPGWLLLSLLDEFTLKRIEAETTGVERGSMKSRRRWREDRFEAFIIDLPPLVVQRTVLERLDALQNLRQAISEELAARRQQYEYYRDKLLTYEEIG